MQLILYTFFIFLSIAFANFQSTGTLGAIKLTFKNITGFSDKINIKYADLFNKHLTFKITKIKYLIKINDNNFKISIPIINYTEYCANTCSHDLDLNGIYTTDNKFFWYQITHKLNSMNIYANSPKELIIDYQINVTYLYDPEIIYPPDFSDIIRSLIISTFLAIGIIKILKKLLSLYIDITI